MAFTFIRLNSGKKIDFVNPLPRQIDIHDIAYSLSGKCRFNDHTNEFYSVAQHCCNCCDNISDRDLAFEALMHDASEAYVGDVSAPLKALIPDYKKIEERVEKIIAKKFNLIFPHPPEVKEIDMVMLVTEMRDFMPGNDRKVLPFIPLPERLVSWDSNKAYEQFLMRYEQYR